MSKKKKSDYELITADAYEDNSQVISFGNPVLDSLTAGGVHTGRLTEIYGEWSTGKSVLGYSLLAEAQKLGGYTLLVESEGSFSPEFVQKCGVDLKKLRILQATKEYPLTLSVFFKATAKEMRLARRNYPFSLVVLDSLAGCPPTAMQADGDEAFDNIYMGLMAREVSKGLLNLKPLLRPYNCALVIVNQVRDKIGVMFGTKSDSPGGKACKFYADIRVLLHNPKKEKKGDSIVAGFYVAKSKMCEPWGKAKFKISFAGGLDPTYGVIEEPEEEEMISDEE